MTNIKLLIMNILKTTLLAILVLLLLPITAQSQEEEESFIMTISEFTIKYGQDSKFTEGVKKWNKCYKDNNGTNTWRVWHRLQGKGNVYVLSGMIKNWAEMEKTDPAGKACRTVALDFITPHIESVEFNTTRSIPEISRKAPLGDGTIVWVNNFKVNNSVAFNEVVKEVTSAIAKKEGDKRGYWYRVMGGEGADYFVSSPFKDFADLDRDKDNVWKVYESVHGKSKTKELRDKFNATLDDAWSYTFTLEKELSNQ